MYTWSRKRIHFVLEASVDRDVQKQRVSAFNGRVPLVCLGTRDDSCVAPVDLFTTGTVAITDQMEHILSLAFVRISSSVVCVDKKLNLLLLNLLLALGCFLEMVIYENLPLQFNNMDSQAIYVSSKEIRSRKRFGVCAPTGNYFDLVSFIINNFLAKFDQIYCIAQSRIGAQNLAQRTSIVN